MLPAAPEARSIWMNKFGFERISDKQVCLSSPLFSFALFTSDLSTSFLCTWYFDLQLKDYRKDYPVMVFQGTTILHKPVCKR